MIVVWANIDLQATKIRYKKFCNFIGGSYSLYIGLRRRNNINNNAGFEWTDGTPVTYSDWYEGEPSNHENKENCVVMEMGEAYDKNFKWNDVRCDTWDAYYICQRASGTKTFFN